MNERLKIETFYLLMNTAPVFNIDSLLKLIEQINSPENFWKLTKDDILKLDIDEKDRQKLLDKLEKITFEELSLILNDIDCEIAVYSDEKFPKTFNRYKYSPIMLFYKGNIKLLNHPYIISIVGTRKSSHYGETLVAQLIKDIKPNDYPVITGTAFGIDSCVIKSCIEEEHKCISVLASGIDKISPQQSASLLKNLVAHGGCYFTEFPPGIVSYKSNYPIRAKIIAAISSDVIIVEAPNKSGALLVAQEAFEFRKNIYCLPSFHYDSNFWGSHYLIDSGIATLVKDFEDIKPYITTK